MNTIIDLNIGTNVNYNNEASYAISFGTNLGNTTQSLDGFGTANIKKQTSLTSVTDAVRDLLIDVQFSNVGKVTMAYVGTWANIGLLQIAPSIWRVNGIRSVAQYNEAFANVKYSDLTGGSTANIDYTYLTTVNDQSGNTRTWSTGVDIIEVPYLTVTGNVIYNEDTLTNVTVANVVIDPASVLTFRLYANTIPTYGSMTDGVVTGNSIYIDGTGTSLNSQITAGGLKFLPASDYTSNVANAINFSIGNTTTIFSTANANIQIGNTHAEYNFPTTGTYVEDTRYSFGNTISDLDTRAISFTVNLLQTSGNIGQWYRNSSLVGNANTTLSITGSKNSINNTIQWMPPIDYTGNVTFRYDQLKTLSTGNVTQASNVVATFTATTNPEISNMTARTITANAVANIFATTTPYINDGPDYGQSYTITLSSPIGKFGNSAANAIASSTYTYTGNTTQVNNEFTNMKFVNDYGIGAQTSSFTYTQSRDGVAQVNTSPTLTITAGSVGNTYTRIITSNSTFTPTIDQVLFGNIQILSVGGGGGGAGGGGGLSNDTIKGTGGGGGAGGQAQLINATPGSANALQAVTYSVVVGSGGAGNIANANVVTASSGSASYLQYGGTTLFYSAGGSGGVANATTPSSSSGGSNGLYSGGAGGQAFSGGQGNARVGGGGAGAGAVGGNADLGSFPAEGGDGGIGFAAAPSGQTFGNHRWYGGGGGGGRLGQGASGTGGGGDGNGQPGTDGRGGGGGGSTWFYKAGGNGNGGSGTIVIKIS